ncbi:MAG: ATP-binding protein [Bacteroidia bacterium]|nr:ATP-binding protein [Bacteroidia bacterium]
MIKRHVYQQILEDLSYFPSVGIIGPRQVGKTTLAQWLQTQLKKPSLYLDMEDEATYTKLLDAGAYLSRFLDYCVIIDEIQLKPDLFGQLRSLIDMHRVPERFILLGSASPLVIRQSSESLAGRIAYTELTPFSFLEIAHTHTLVEHWLRGGFPDSFLAPSDRMQKRWMSNFVTTFLQRDLQALGYEIPINTMSNLLRMLSHVNAGVLNMSELSRSLGISQPTVAKYLDLLEGSFLIQRVQPYFVNISKRLVKAPKIYIRDSGILHYLAQVTSYEDLLGHPIAGGSWESYVIEQIRRCVSGEWQFYYYRTHVGAEIDLLLITPDRKKIAIEIKLSTAPVVSKGFYESIGDLQPDHSYVIVPSGEKYPKAGGLWVISLEEFLKEELPKMMIEE